MTKTQLAQIKSNFSRDVLSRSSYTLEDLERLADEHECDLEEAASIAALALTPAY